MFTNQNRLYKEQQGYYSQQDYYRQTILLFVNNLVNCLLIGVPRGYIQRETWGMGHYAGADYNLTVVVIQLFIN